MEDRKLIKSKILHGNSIELLKDFEENSIDSIVTDGPYGLGFMGKEWDKFTSKEYQDFSFEWGSQALRVLKPGGLVASFSAPKKYHRMVCGLEDAGFTIKDMINWCFGSGFPKSLNISLAINKLLGGSIEKGEMIVAPDGQTYDKRKKIGNPLTDNCYGGDIIEEEDLYEKIPTHPKALELKGWGTGLKPAHEPIVLAQKPYGKTYAENVLKWGVGGLNIDDCRIKYQPTGEDSRVYDPEKNIIRVKREASKHTVSFPAMSMPYAKPKGRWPSNMILTHHPECNLIGEKRVKTSTLLATHNIDNEEIKNRLSIKAENSRRDYGKEGYDIVNAYDCHPECPVRMLDEQSGDQPTSFRPNLIGKNYESDSMFGQGGNMSFRNQHKDKGGASRFFYCAKAHKSERNVGCEDLYWEKTKEGFKRITENQYDMLPTEKSAKGNPVSTLKPINLMRYIARLITPTNGVVLDPFAGSGTTGIACIIEGFNYILIEKRESFVKTIIPKRLEHWKNPNSWSILKDHPLLPEIKMKITKTQNKSIKNWV